MDTINAQLNQLNSVDKDIRLGACKNLLRAQSLTPEAIYALGLVVLDTDIRVARCARIALLVHQLKLRKIAVILVWIAGLVIGVVFFWLVFNDLFKTSILTCERENPGAVVNCFEQPYFFDLVPLPEKEIKDVRGVEILVITDDDDLELYNLELTTGSGKVELDSGFSYNYREKRKMADQIEVLVNSSLKKKLVIHDSGYLTWSTAAVICGFPVALLVIFGLAHAISEVRQRILPSRRRVKPSNLNPKLIDGTRQVPDEPKIFLQKRWGSAKANHHKGEGCTSLPKRS